MRYLKFIVLLFISGVYAEQPSEPDGYYSGEYHAPTPSTLAGANVVDDHAAYQLWQSGAVFIEVMQQAPKPPNLPEDTLWIEARRTSIENASWLANVGFGSVDAQGLEYFVNALARLSQADKTKPLVFFCLPDCWMSWNAAKRALSFGYTDVSWYPNGIEGWQFNDYPTQQLQVYQLD